MAARKILVPFNFTQQEIQNAVVHVLASAPGSPVAGQIWYNSTSGRLEYRGASGTIDPTARANHSGTQTSATISDFDTQVRTSRLDQMALPTADVSLNSHKLTNVTDPSANQDAATKKYVDDRMLGITGVKDPVVVAAQANVTLSAPGATIDGVTMSTNDRFLAPAQTTTTEKGIYIFNGSATPATRAIDADGSSEIADGTIVAVAQGTDAGKQYIQTATVTGAPGTYSQVWTIINTGGTAYSAGNGLTLTSTTFDVGAGTGITVNANDVAVDIAVVARKFTQLIGDGSSTSIAVTHSLSNQFPVAAVYEVATSAVVECDMVGTSTSVMTFIFAVAPTSNQYRVVIQG